MGREFPANSRPAVPLAVRARTQPSISLMSLVDVWVAQLSAAPTWQSQKISKLLPLPVRKQLT